MPGDSLRLNLHAHVAVLNLAAPVERGHEQVKSIIRAELLHRPTALENVPLDMVDAQISYDLSARPPFAVNLKHSDDQCLILPQVSARGR
jgi:hypothetical protein